MLLNPTTSLVMKDQPGKSNRNENVNFGATLLKANENFTSYKKVTLSHNESIVYTPCD
mgnify:CR=1 FL=1